MSSLVDPPSQMRQSSSSRHPRSGVPLPKRVVVKRRWGTAEEMLGEIRNESWQAGVRKVQSCSLGEYDGVKGLKTVYNSND